MTVPASLSKWAHPPRSNTPRRSSSDPPGPCITPSTETCVVVVSFMVAVPFSLSLSSFESTGPRRRSHSSQQSPSGDSFRTLPEHGPHIGDVVLLNGHREHRPALFRVRAAAAEGLQRRLRLPALEDADTARGRPGPRRSYVEAANCPPSLFDDAHTAREVVLALIQLNDPAAGHT